MSSPAQRLAAVVGIIVPLGVEAAFLAAYSREAASWHWYIHFFAGATLALVLMTLWTRRHHRAVSHPLAWVLAGHLYAAVPDILIPESVPHQAWQEVFVAHIASHYLPGRDLSWLLLFATALAAYLHTVATLRATTQPAAPR